MDANQTGPAKLYYMKRKDAPYLVAYRDPTTREKSGRARRIVKWFGPGKEKEAGEYRDELNEQLLTEGAAGATFDANQRGDAIAARRHLDTHGQLGTSLLHLAQRYTQQVTSHASSARPIGPEVDAF